jgi:hypothetical protein
MAAKKKMPGWLLGCTVGCGVLVFAGLVLLGAGAFWMAGIFEGFDRAETDAEALADRFGPPEAYVPAPDGAIPPDRMEAFLAVRGALGDRCAEVEQTFGVLRRIDRAGDQGQPPLRDVLGVARSAMQIAPLTARLLTARNRALLETDMGIGEYTYIYMVAYRSGRQESVDAADPPLGPGDEKFHDAALRMLPAQRERLAAERPDDPLLPALDAEIAALGADERRLPWPDGLPAAVERSLLPYRERLDALACPAAAGLELARSRRRGLAIEIE